MNDTLATPVSLAELARATEDLPFVPNEGTLTPAPAPLTPSAEDIEILTTQYKKAVNGLYEAYLFGQMLLAVQKRLSLSLTRETKGEWHAPAGSGIKGWLAQHCPDINYKTALRFLAVAEKTNAALILSDEASAGAGEHPLPGEKGAERPHQAPSEEAVRAYLEGKSQRQLLKAPKAEPAVRHAPTPEERAERIRETFAGFLTSLEGMVRTEETDVLRPNDRRELVTRLKSLARTLEAMAE